VLDHSPVSLGAARVVHHEVANSCGSVLARGQERIHDRPDVLDRFPLPGQFRQQAVQQQLRGRSLTARCRSARSVKAGRAPVW